MRHFGAVGIAGRAVALVLLMAVTSLGFGQVRGDVNGDGTVNPLDAGMIKDHLLERSKLTSVALPRADVDSDGKVRMSDFVWVTNHPYDLRESTTTLPGDVPLVMVRITSGSYPLYMGKYEVTQRQWQALMGSNPARSYGVGDKYPVYYISWDDCQTFVAALNAHVNSTSQGLPTFRLPTEGEWEYACRAGTKTRYFFGDSWLADDRGEDGPAGTLPGNRSDYMWYMFNMNTPTYGCKEVGTKLPNQFGLYDMSGNLLEWCQDWYSVGSDRVCRGGCWNGYARGCQSATRNYYPPDSRKSSIIGLRLIRTSAVERSITIDVTPDDGSWTLTGPAGFTALVGTGDRRGGSTIFYVPAGAYTLSCSDNVVGYNPPPPETKVLSASQGTIAFTPSYTPETGPDEITISLPGNVPLVLVRITSGSFQMGSPDTERGREGDEGPVRTISLDYSFYMGQYEVTQKQWLALMGRWPGSAPSSNFGVGDDYPAYFVSWDDAQNFVAALNSHVSRTGQEPATFRLPTEAEWEYACRAGTQTRFFFGDSLTVGDWDEDGPAGTLPGNRSDYMWFWFNYAIPTNGCKQVGTKLPNQFGLYDMSGNLWEWCQNWYQVGNSRVCRGGSWYYAAKHCRSARRGYNNPTYRYESVGFRLLRTP